MNDEQRGTSKANGLVALSVGQRPTNNRVPIRFIRVLKSEISNLKSVI